METKHSTFGIEDLSLYHNAQISATDDQPITVASFFNPYRNIVAGTSVTNRVGNEIYPRGISVRMYLENLPGHPNLYYRIIIGLAPKQTTTGAATTFNNLTMLDAGSAGNLVRHIAADQGYTILYDKMIRNELGNSTDGSSPDRCHVFKKFFIKAKKGSKIVYHSSATGVVANITGKPMFMCVIPYDSQNTTALLMVAKLNYQAKMYWKDA